MYISIFFGYYPAFHDLLAVKLFGWRLDDLVGSFGYNSFFFVLFFFIWLDLVHLVVNRDLKSSN